MLRKLKQVTDWRNVIVFFQDLYRKLLEAESEGILEDADMTKVERLILDPHTR